MDMFDEKIISIQWWIGVVVFSIAINIVSTILVKWMERFYSLLSSNFKQKSKIKKQSYERLIQEIIKDPNKVIVSHLDVLKQLILCFGIGVFSAIIFALGLYSGNQTILTITFISSLFGFIYALLLLNIARRKNRLNRDINKKLCE